MVVDAQGSSWTRFGTRLGLPQGPGLPEAEGQEKGGRAGKVVEQFLSGSFLFWESLKETSWMVQLGLGPL